jgi:hypothetical protein
LDTTILDTTILDTHCFSPASGVKQWVSRVCPGFDGCPGFVQGLPGLGSTFRLCRYCARDARSQGANVGQTWRDKRGRANVDTHRFSPASGVKQWVSRIPRHQESNNGCPGFQSGVKQWVSRISPGISRISSNSGGVGGRMPPSYQQRSIGGRSFAAGSLNRIEHARGNE